MVVSLFADKNLVIALDLSFNGHIANVYRKAFIQLKTMLNYFCFWCWNRINALITSRLDYCNVLLSGCPVGSINKLQLVQEASRNMITSAQYYHLYIGYQCGFVWVLNFCKLLTEPWSAQLRITYAVFYSVIIHHSHYSCKILVCW